jgi:hypothetical protein
VFDRFTATTLRRLLLVAPIAALLAALLLSLIPLGEADAERSARDRATGRTPTVALSAEPERLEVSSCLPGTLNVGMQNVSSEPVYGEAYIGAEEPLELSREVVVSYLPVGYEYVVPVGVSVPRDAATGDYAVLLESGERGRSQRLSVPVAVVEPDNCVFEAESLLPAVEATAPADAQSNCCGIRWSGGAQVWFRASDADQRFTVAFDVPKAGTYDLSTVLTKAPDYGIHTLSVDGQRIGEPFDGYDPTGVSTQEVNYGTVQLDEGRHTLTLTVTGKNAASRGFFAGVDLIQLKKSPGASEQ